MKRTTSIPVLLPEGQENEFRGALRIMADRRRVEIAQLVANALTQTYGAEIDTTMAQFAALREYKDGQLNTEFIVG